MPSADQKTVICASRDIACSLIAWMRASGRGPCAAGKTEPIRKQNASS
jgi:hypothetical protein